MNNFIKKEEPISTHLMCLLMIGGFLFSGNFAFAQLQRSYATRQASNVVDGLGTASISNSAYAIDGDASTASNFNISSILGASVEQILDFDPNPNDQNTYSATIAANTPITVKINLPAGFLSALSSVEIQAVTGLQKAGSNWSYTNVGTNYSATSLLSLISGTGSAEVTIIPTNAFQGIRVKLSGLLSSNVNFGLYHAFVMVPATSNFNCSEIIDVLSGEKPTPSGVVSQVDTVANTWNAIDNSITTYATMHADISVLNATYLTAIFNTPSKIGDSLNIMAQNTSSTLLNAAALSGFQINLYNGTTLVQTLLNTSSLLQINLFNPTGNIMMISVVPTTIFDRVELTLGNNLNILEDLRLYNIQRKNAGVILTSQQANLYVYAGQSYSLSASPIATGDNIVFYDALTNGNIVSLGPTVTTLAQGGNILSFYAAASRAGCSEISDRKEIDVHVIAVAKNTPDTGYLNSSYNSNIIVNSTNSNVLPLTPVLTYSTTSPLPPGLVLNPNTGAITGTPTATGMYPIIVEVTDVANNLPVGTFIDTIPVFTTGSPTGSPLAISLADFKCDGNGQQVTLSWNTYSEINNLGFSIEKSANGIKFESIGFMNSLYEDGNGTDIKKYLFIDNRPYSGVNFYRLKQEDKAGKSVYSNVVSWTNDSKNNIKIYPNPASNVINIEAQNATAIYVYNMLGQLIFTPKVNGNGLIQINTTDFINGYYVIKIISNQLMKSIPVRIHR